MEFDTQLVIDSLPKLWLGTLLTLEMVVYSLLIGFVFALGLALMRLSKNPVLSSLAFGYIYLFRGTPLIVQLFFIYHGLGQVEWFRDLPLIEHVYRDAWFYGLVALVANTAAYQAEIIRGGIESVTVGETEAAKASGMSTFLRFRRITLPIALIRMLPGFGNEAILLMKGSAILSLITIRDLMGWTEKINSRFYAPIEMYLSAAVFYLAIAAVITLAVRALEYYMTPHLRARPGDNAGGFWTGLKNTVSLGR